MTAFEEIGRLPAEEDNCGIAVRTLPVGMAVEFEEKASPCPIPFWKGTAWPCVPLPPSWDVYDYAGGAGA